jgi:hypothetical protein
MNDQFIANLAELKGKGELTTFEWKQLVILSNVDRNLAGINDKLGSIVIKLVSIDENIKK